MDEFDDIGGGEARGLRVIDECIKHYLRPSDVIIACTSAGSDVCPRDCSFTGVQ
jgi:hypothetical protein